MRSITTLIIALLLVLVDSVYAHSVEQPASQPYQGENSQKKQQDRNRQEEEEEEPLDFSDTGRPGKQTAGESRSICPNLNSQDSLAAIVPTSHAGKTVAAHPSFWVYFPYSSNQVDRVEFVVQNADREDIWRSQSQMHKGIESIGYKSFSLPKTIAPLEVDQWYRWYVKVYCDTQTTSTKFVQSWIKRVPLSSKLYMDLQDKAQIPHKIYSNYGIWYDAIDGLLGKYHNEPSNLPLEQDWQNLVEAKGVDLHHLPEIGGRYEAVK